MTDDFWIDGLRRLRDDHRIGSVLAEDAGVRLTLWVLEQRKETRACALLYGWVLAAPANAPVARWSTSNTQLAEDCRLVRLTLATSSRTITEVIESLLAGRTLEDASRASSLDPPDRVAKLRLPTSYAAAPGAYGLGPVILLETEVSIRDRLRSTVPMRSPNAEAPGFSVSLFLADKAQIWSREGADAPMFSHTVVREALERLRADTALDFFASDAARLGNVEFMNFPSADAREQAAVQVRIASRLVGPSKSKRPEKIEISIRPSAVAATDSLIVRCRQLSRREVSRDDCRIVPGDVGTLAFDVVQPLGATTVEVWRRSVETDDYSLWFAHRYHWIGRIEMDMGIAGLGGRIESDLLTAARSNKRLADRASRLMTVSQVHYERSVAGEPEDGWESSTEQGRRLVSRLVPPASDGRFFAKGWQADGQLSFLEWFRENARRLRYGKLVLLDPYFDTVGVEMIARMESTDLSYAAVTCTAPPSRDDASPGDRVSRLRDACAQLEPVLRRLDFRLYDVRTSAGNSQPFHDRLLLLFDADDTIARGYHLSNSIQAATKNFPLLVTPIPDDLLGPVADYVQGLLSGTDNTTVDVVYRRPDPSKARRAHEETRRRELIAPRLANVLGLAPEELQNGETESEDDAAVALIAERARSRIPQLAAALSVADLGDFHRLWSSLAAISARSAAGRTLMEEVVSSDRGKLRDALVRDLEHSIAVPAPEGLGGTEVSASLEGLTHWFSATFASALEPAEHFVTHATFRGLGIEAWGVRKAIGVLATTDPAALIDVAARTEALMRSRAHTERAPCLNLLALIVGELVERLSRSGAKGMAQALIRSRCAFLRALGARAASIVLPSADAIECLRGLESDEEAIFALAEWVFALRVTANRKGFVESADVEALRIGAFKEMIRRWPAERGGTAFLRSVFRRVGGPGEGSWAATTVADLLRPLVDRGALSWSDIVDLLVSNVWSRIEPNLREGPAPDGDPSRTQFHASTDAELTDVAAGVLALADATTRLTRRTEIEKAMTAAARVLTRSFLRSSDYATWASLVDGLTWGAAFLGMWWLHGANGALETVELDAIRHAAETTWLVLDNQRVERMEDDVTRLRELERRVRAAIEEELGRRAL